MIVNIFIIFFFGCVDVYVPHKLGQSLSLSLYLVSFIELVIKEDDE